MVTAPGSYTENAAQIRHVKTFNEPPRTCIWQ